MLRTTYYYLSATQNLTTNLIQSIEIPSLVSFGNCQIIFVSVSLNSLKKQFWFLQVFIKMLYIKNDYSKKGYICKIKEMDRSNCIFYYCIVMHCRCYLLISYSGMLLQRLRIAQKFLRTSLIHSVLYLCAISLGGWTSVKSNI